MRFARTRHAFNRQRKTDVFDSGPELLLPPPGASMLAAPLVVSAVIVVTVAIVQTVATVVTAATVLPVAAPSALHLVPAVVTTLLARKTAVSATTTAATVPVAPRTVSARGSAM